MPTDEPIALWQAFREIPARRICVHAAPSIDGEVVNHVMEGLARILSQSGLASAQTVRNAIDDRCPEFVVPAVLASPTEVVGPGNVQEPDLYVLRVFVISPEDGRRLLGYQDSEAAIWSSTCVAGSCRTTSAAIYMYAVPTAERAVSALEPSFYSLNLLP